MLTLTLALVLVLATIVRPPQDKRRITISTAPGQLTPPVTYARNTSPYCTCTVPLRQPTAVGGDTSS